MIEDIEHRIVRLQNEIKALKGSQLLSGGQLAFGEYSLEWSGNIKNGDFINLDFKFTRSDDIQIPPLAEISYELENPEDFRNGGTSSQLLTAGAVVDVGENFITFRVVMSADTFFGEAIAKILVEVKSIVPGVLTVRRIV